MSSDDFYQMCLSQFQEARLYFDQGLKEEAVVILETLLDQVAQSDVSEPKIEGLRIKIERQLLEFREGAEAVQAATVLSEGIETSGNPAQDFQYAKTLIDSHLWEEAIDVFKKVAASGHQVMECWELCGDCAASMENWKEATGYYEIVYANPLVPEDQKQRLLRKITRCSQVLKRISAETARLARAKTETVEAVPREAPEPAEPVMDSVPPIDQRTMDELIGREIRSWQTPRGTFYVEEPQTYRITNLLHIGRTSQIFELQQQGSGERLVGQMLIPPWDKCLQGEAFGRWAFSQMMMDSPHWVEVYDVAHSDSLFFLVREYLDYSLAEFLTEGEFVPINSALAYAVQILEALGYLHLHQGLDREKWKIFHLDLRPSRILLNKEKTRVILYNGGLWQELQANCRSQTAIHRLPLPFLSYRAPEQFRTYLSRRKPPLFTDIYLFGVVFYEMLTSQNPFQASSFEEYEIQHCDQYPNPPKVWRPDIPEELSNIIMKCLEIDPIKRWRSTTELSLAIERFGPF